jgi:hypothetical protein
VFWRTHHPSIITILPILRPSCLKLYTFTTNISLLDFFHIWDFKHLSFLLHNPLHFKSHHFTLYNNVTMNYNAIYQPHSYCLLRNPFCLKKSAGFPYQYVSCFNILSLLIIYPDSNGSTIEDNEAMNTVTTALGFKFSVFGLICNPQIQSI